jgi:hypothetical protein
MAQKTTVQLLDDLTGGPATETVRFALDRKPLEIDLNDANAARLRAELAKYIRHARHVGGPRMARMRALAAAPAEPLPGKPSKSSVTATNRVKPYEPAAADIRAWAKTQPGVELKARGRIPADVKQAYLAASGRRRGVR